MACDDIISLLFYQHRKDTRQIRVILIARLWNIRDANWIPNVMNDFIDTLIKLYFKRRE